jgi:hypothetical protein
VFNFIKKLVFLSTLMYIDFAHACPGCAGSMNNPKDSRIAYILMAFVALAYIPGYIVFKTIYKNRKDSPKISK